MRSVRIVVLLSVIGLVCTPFLITRSHAERAAGKRETPLATKGMTTIAPTAQPQQGPQQLQQAVENYSHGEMLWYLLQTPADSPFSRRSMAHWQG